LWRLFADNRAPARAYGYAFYTLDRGRGGRCPAATPQPGTAPRALGLHAAGLSPPVGVGRDLPGRRLARPQLRARPFTGPDRLGHPLGAADLDGAFGRATTWPSSEWPAGHRRTHRAGRHLRGESQRPRRASSRSQGVALRIMSWHINMSQGDTL